MMFSKGGDREIVLISIVVHVLSLVESIVMRMNKEGG